MCYSASRLNIDPVNMIHIDVDDMERAIEDGKKYLKMWKLAMSQWAKYGKDTKQDELKSGKYDVEKLVGIAFDNGGTICVSEVMKLGFPDRVKIGERLNLGVTMGLLEFAYVPGPGGGSGLSKEEHEHYNKICHGNFPQIWSVTEAGKKKCGEV